MLASKRRELVPQHHQFHVLGDLGTLPPNEQPNLVSKFDTLQGGEEARPQIEELAFEGAMLTSDSGTRDEGFSAGSFHAPTGALEARVPDLPAAPRSPLEAAPFLHAPVP